MTGNASPAAALFAPYGSFLEHTLAETEVVSPGVGTALPDGTAVNLLAPGVLHIQPAQPATRQLVISAGIHGNETAPIEVCDRLVTELLGSQWRAETRTLIILGNPPAMVRGERFIDYNLNRLFGGTHRKPGFEEFWERGRAAELEQLVRDFLVADLPLFHYDLHTAIRESRHEKFALYPFVPGRQLPAAQMQFLLESDVDTVLYQHKAGSTFASWTSTEFAAESFTVELGKVRPFGENDHSRFKAVKNSLRRLIQAQWPTPDQHTRAAMNEFKVVHEILNSGSEFVFHVADDVANFTEFPPGTLIWEDAENQYRVGDVPEAIVFPNPAVPVGQRVGLMVARLP